MKSVILKRKSRLLLYIMVLSLGYYLMPFWHPELFNDTYNQDNLSRLGLEIERLVGDVSCERSTQCRAIGYGVNPCGGYERYLVSSDKTASYLLLRYKVGVYNRIGSYLINEEALACPIIVEPILQCIAGKCQEMKSE